MWIPGQRLIDEPIRLLGFEIEDLGLLVSLSCGLMLALDVVPWLLATLGLGCACYYGKRGKPPGAMRHWLHEMGFWPISGAIPPQTRTYR